MVGYEVLRESKVQVAKHEARIPCAPVDSFIHVALQHLVLPMFFDYELNGERLLNALKKVSEKYPCVCGRVAPDSQSRYAIEVFPASEESNGFPFTEARADLSVAETILKHSKVKEEYPEFPCSPRLPFFMEGIDLTEALDGKAPLMKVKLTHLTDGCVVNLAIAHVLVDGQRAAELLRDIGRVYCGREIRDRVHDRSYQWPDRLVECFPFLGDEVAGLPRSCAEEQEIVGFPKTYDQPIETEILLFSKELLDGLNKKVSSCLSAGEYVSRNDLVLAVLWMFFAETRAKQHPVKTGSDLRIYDTVAVTVAECLMSGIDVVPENYCGNASHGIPLVLAEEDVRGKSFCELLAFLALFSRKSLNRFREQPTAQARAFLGYYRLLNSDVFNGDDGNNIPLMKLTSFDKTAVRAVDFGQGNPVLAHITLPLPLYGAAVTAGPGPRNDESILVYCQLTKEEFKRLNESVIIRTCVPEMKRLYNDFSLEEMRAFLGME